VSLRCGLGLVDVHGPVFPLDRVPPRPFGGKSGPQSARATWAAVFGMIWRASSTRCSAGLLPPQRGGTGRPAGGVRVPVGSAGEPPVQGRRQLPYPAVQRDELRPSLACGGRDRALDSIWSWDHSSPCTGDTKAPTTEDGRC